jgi:hypothetical protein
VVVFIARNLVLAILYWSFLTQFLRHLIYSASCLTERVSGFFTRVPLPDIWHADAKISHSGARTHQVLS